MKTPATSLQPSRQWLLCAALLLLGLTLDAGAQSWESWHAYSLGTGTTAVTPPEGAEELNSLLPEPTGGYIALWDTADSVIVERRDPSGTLAWSWSPPRPLPVPSELTRAVYSSRTHTLWCSTARWFFLNNTNGTVYREGTWNLPYLDPSRIIIQDEKIHILYEGSSLVYVTNVGVVRVTYASIYDTNMEHQAVITTAVSPGFWHSFAGAWLLDFSQRTNQFIRLCTVEPGLAVGTPFNVALPTGPDGGYVDHRVLGADTNSILILSSVHWPILGQTKHYFSTVDRGGTLRAQHALNCNQIITGCAATADGWILSAQFFTEGSPRHTFFKVDAQGRPYWQTVVDTGGPFSYRLLNVAPPRVLKLLNATDRVVLDVQDNHWWEETGTLIWPSVQWTANPPPAPLASTNCFWITPLRLNP